MKKLLLLSVLAVVGLIVPSIVTAQITTFPYTQDFESFAQCGGSCTSTCALQDNWVNAASATRDFASDIGGTGSNPTGPQTGGTAVGRYLYTEASSPCYTGSNSWHLESPTIDLTGTNDIQFNFWYHMYGQSMGTAHIDVTEDGGLTWTLDVIPAWTDNQDLWQEETVSLAAFTGVVTVRLRYEDPPNYYGDFAFDNVTIYDLLQNDAGISAFINPDVPTCNFNDSVEVELTNFGTDTLFNVNINWQWNAAVQTALAWTGSLLPGASMNVYLGSVAYGVGDDLIAWTDTPNGVTEIPSGTGNDSQSLIGLNTGLAGTYVIGATGDYLDFATAVADLNMFGVCGPVVFEAEDGVYNEQFILGSVIGMDATNTVTFRSQSGDQALVTISFAATLSTENYVIALDNADYYSFEQMTIENSGVTYGRVLDFQGGSNWNTVTGCHLNSLNTTTTSTNRCVIYSASGNNNDNNWFVDNVIEGGSYGMYWYGTGTTSLTDGTVVDGNDFLNNYYYGCRQYYVNNTVFTNNRTYGESTYTGTRFANYFYYCDGAFKITGNEIYSLGTSGWYYGIYLGQSDGAASDRGLVANNMIQVGKPGTTSTMYGIYSTNSGFMDIYGNNVLVSEGGASSRALYVTSGGATEVKNNNFVNYTAGYGVYLASSFSVSEMDFNNIHSPGGNVGFFGANQATLADWQAASGFDVNGMDLDPLYHSATDLHVCADTLNGAGITHPSVTVDFDGQPRAATPDIGADEFSPLSTAFLGSDISLCTGDSIQLAAGAPSDAILWSTGDTTLAIWVSTAGTYDVSIVGVCGSGADTIIVTAAADVYAGYLVADSLWFCAGGSVELTSNMTADTYAWTGGSTNDSLTVTAGGTYTLDITDACGSGSESVVIEEFDTPVAGFTSTTSFATGVFTNTSTGGGNATYSWDFGDSNSSTESDPIHAYGNPTSFLVTLTVTNECGTDTFSDSITLSTVGIDDLFLNGDVSVYPNPSKGEFTIDMTVLVSSDITVQVENILGAIVYVSTPGSVQGTYSESISLGNAPAGMYFVRVFAGEQQLVKKIIVE
ncbi:MAG: T9SS type A sorting domain-containing protein [Crocinitomicaceae bacterium]|nr:T9SS type A sorting domain-containing protein [Flavobacteriales bacterium]NQZ37657.1 T9SS type A sorting domain-containing protein [Crocinitomicaceae bacterium]